MLHGDKLGIRLGSTLFSSSNLLSLPARGELSRAAVWPRLTSALVGVLIWCLTSEAVPTECAALLPSLQEAKPGSSLVFLSRDWEVCGFPRESASLVLLEIAVFCLACGWRDEGFQEPQINRKYSSESQNSAYCRCWWFLQLHFLGLCVGFLQLCTFPWGICVSPLQNLCGAVCRDSAAKALQRCREGPQTQFGVVGDVPSAICVLSTTEP